MLQAFAELKGMLADRGYLDSDDEGVSDWERECNYTPQGKRGHTDPTGKTTPSGGSDTRIYRPAIRPARGSSSSEGVINTSNETIELNLSMGGEDLQVENIRIPSIDFVRDVISDYQRQSNDQDHHQYNCERSETSA